VTHPVPVTAIDNFSYPEIQNAAQLSDPFTAALVFSTGYDPPHLLISLGHWNDFRRDLSPGAIARILDGNVTWQAERRGQWAAVLHFERPQEAKLAGPF